MYPSGLIGNGYGHSRAALIHVFFIIFNFHCNLYALVKLIIIIIIIMHGKNRLSFSIIISCTTIVVLLDLENVVECYVRLHPNTLKTLINILTNKNGPQLL